MSIRVLVFASILIAFPSIVKSSFLSATGQDRSEFFHRVFMDGQSCSQVVCESNFWTGLCVGMRFFEKQFIVSESVAKHSGNFSKLLDSRIFNIFSSIEPIQQKADSQSYNPAKNQSLEISQIRREVEQINSAVHTIKNILLYGSGGVIGIIVAYIIILIFQNLWPNCYSANSTRAAPCFHI